MKVHKNVRVHGKVIGVFFRLGTTQKAHELDLRGFVQNEADDTVYLEVEGTEEKVNQLLEWLKDGPPRAEVSNLDISEGPVVNLGIFETRRI